jgi:SAM-dependent methyltransferase
MVVATMPGLPGLFADITAPYGVIEAWAYDRLVAPAVAEMFEQNLDEILDLVPRGAQILDVGCGGGQALDLLAARRPDLHLHGVDLSPDQAGRARARLGDRATIVERSALELPYASDRFDLVFSDASIKHWPDPASGLGEFVRRWRLPRILLPLGLALFRTWVAGQAFDLAEFEAFGAALPLDERRARRIEGTPGIVLEGTRRLGLATTVAGESGS